MNMYIKVPFVNDNLNEFFKDEINKLYTKYFPQIKPNLVFKLTDRGSF